MEVKCKISPRLITNISSLYTDPNRVIMEYIDNSVDSADKTNILMNSLIGEAIEYPNLPEIKINISGKT